MYRRFKLHYGQLFWIWAAWYGVQRFLLDSLRVGSGDAQVGSMTWNQVSGFALAAFAIGMLFWFDTRQPLATPENDAKLGAKARQHAQVDTSRRGLTRRPETSETLKLGTRLRFQVYAMHSSRYYFYFAFTGPRSGMA